MRKALVSLMVLSLAPALAGAGVTNPDGFEGYALTSQWTPTEIGNGWTTGAEGPEGVNPGNHNDIVMGSNGNDTQVYRGDSSNRDGEPFPPAHPGENIYAYWYQSTPDAAVSVTTTSWDWCCTSNFNGSEFRTMVNRYEGAPYYYTWFVEFNEVGSAHTSDLRVCNGIDVNGNGTYDITPIPADGIEYEWYVEDVWYHVDVQEDNGPLGVGNGQSSRARFGLMGATEEEMGSWSEWLVHEGPNLFPGADPYTRPMDDGEIRVSTNGAAEYDNFTMAEDPGGDPCNPGDANNDDLVSADDYASVQGAFGNTGAIGIPGDANCDGLVSADDYASVQSNFGTTYGGATVPEPATMLLLTAGSLLLMKRKRKS